MGKELIKEDTKIELKPDDIGLVMKPDGEIQIIMPKLEDDDNVPVHVQFLTGIVMLMETDKAFVDEVLERFYTLLAEKTSWKPDIQPIPDKEKEVSSTVSRDQVKKEVKASITITQVDEDIDGVGC